MSEAQPPEKRPAPGRNESREGAHGESRNGESANRRNQTGRRKNNRLYAALDLGTNNCRLLIVEGREKDQFKVRDSFTRIVRLGEGLEATGALSEDAMQRTIAALRICASKIRRMNVGRIRCIATEACRGASNGEEFVRRVRKQTGLRLEIIDGAAEAELATISCAALFNADAENIILFDIGGGSTEVSRLARQEDNYFKITDSDSLPLGVVRLAERHAGPGPREHGYEGMLAESQERLADFMGRQDDITDLDKVQIIGTSGTVTTLAAVQLGLARYDRNVVDGCTIDTVNIIDLINNLRAKSRDELAANPCIGQQRADLVLSGCAVLEAIYRKWPVAQMSVADRGLREGLLIRMMRADRRRNRYRRRNGKRAAQNGAPQGGSHGG